MPKAIVLFADGTGNSSARVVKTNVWRVYEAVDAGPCPEDRRPQMSYYDDGVGTSQLRALALLGGIFGLGLKRNVLDMYRYVCRNYRDGDEIYVFGFSRGAFTIRLVVSLIASQGLVSSQTETELDRKSRLAYWAFRKAFLPRRLQWPTRLFRHLREGVRRLAREHAPESSNLHPGIRFVGVWDTVSAYGGPRNALTRFIDNFIYPLSEPSYRLSERVTCARHALSLDDARESFHPVLWDEVHEQELVDAGKVRADRLAQVWFAGMHADVGGGYPDESLSCVSLLWMLEEAEQAGLRTLVVVKDRFVARADSYGPMHDSRAGGGIYYRYQPRRLSAWLDPVEPTTQNLRDPGIVDDQGRTRGLLRAVRVHESVVKRIQNGTDRYAPLTLPESFTIVPTPSSDHPDQSAGSEESATRIAAMEHVWDLVWWRQRTYSATVVVTALLLLLPFIAGRLPPPPSTRVAGVIRLLTPRDPGLLALPDVAKIWLDAYVDNAGYFFLFAAVLFVCVKWGRRLERGIQDGARAAWNGATSLGEGSTPSISWTQKLRTNAFYQHGTQLLKWTMLPDFVIGPAVMTVAMWLVLLLYCQAALELAERSDSLCHEAQTSVADIAIVQRQFSTRDVCSASFGLVQPDERYVVTFDVMEPWADSGMPTTPVGLDSREFPFPLGYVATLLLRAPDARFLQPVLKIVAPAHGSGLLPRGVYLKPLSVERTADSATRYWAEFTSERRGELFVFANDVMIPLPGNVVDPAYFYRESGVPRGNRGTACVTVQRVAEPRGPAERPPLPVVCRQPPKG